MAVNIRWKLININIFRWTGCKRFILYKGKYKIKENVITSFDKIMPYTRPVVRCIWPNGPQVSRFHHHNMFALKCVSYSHIALFHDWCSFQIQVYQYSFFCCPGYADRPIIKSQYVLQSMVVQSAHHRHSFAPPPPQIFPHNRKPSSNTVIAILSTCRVFVNVAGFQDLCSQQLDVSFLLAAFCSGEAVLNISHC